MAGKKERPFSVVWRDAIRDSGLSSTQKHVAITIATYFDGGATKAQTRGYARLTRDTSLGRRTVIRAVADLERLGVIRRTKTERASVDKSGRPTRVLEPNIYELLPIEAGQLPPQTVHEVHRDSARGAPLTVHEVHRDSARGALGVVPQTHQGSATRALGVVPQTPESSATVAPVLEEPSTRTATSSRLEGRAHAREAPDPEHQEPPVGEEQEQRPKLTIAQCRHRLDDVIETLQAGAVTPEQAARHGAEVAAALIGHLKASPTRNAPHSRTRARDVFAEVVAELEQRDAA